jgi:hypothetical protein
MQRLGIRGEKQGQKSCYFQLLKQAGGELFRRGF